MGPLTIASRLLGRRPRADEAPGAGHAPNLEVGAVTDVGKVRKGNEDAFAVEPALGLLVVADGMGGHNAGEVASRLAVEAVVAAVRAAPKSILENAIERQRLAETAVKLANRTVYDAGQSGSSFEGMGTTIVLALVSGASATIAHVGDSRAYLFARAGMTRLTRDHSVVADQRRQGLITASEEAASPISNLLTRAVGTNAEVMVDTQEVPLAPGDVLLLATDGLTKMVSEDMIALRVGASRAQSAPMSELAGALVRRANEAGGVDNVTVVALRRAGSLGGLKLRP